MTQDETGVMFVVDPVNEQWTMFRRVRLDGESAIDEETIELIDRRTGGYAAGSDRDPDGVDVGRRLRVQ